MVEKGLYTVLESGEYLGLGRSSMYNLIMRGELLSVKVGRSRRVPLIELQKYVERLIQQSLEESGPR